MAHHRAHICPSSRHPARAVTGELATLSLSLPNRRLGFPTTLPPYPTTVPPASIRDPPASAQAEATPRSGTPVLQGFGSDSLAKGGVRAGSGGPGFSSGRGSAVVLVPTHFADAASAEDPYAGVGRSVAGRAAKGGLINLDSFYADEEEGDETSEEEEEDEEEGGDEDDEGSGEEDEEKETSGEGSGEEESSSSGEEGQEQGLVDH